MPRILDALARLMPRRAMQLADEKASRTGPLIALETLGRPVWTPRDYAAFAREGFMQNAVCYRGVRMIAEAAASIPLLLYEGGEEIEEHPLLDLIRRPSADHTGADFFEAWYGFLLVAGNAYVEAVSIGGRLRELHALRPDRLKVVPGADGWSEAFEYTAGGDTVRFAGEVASGVRPILHVKLFHPANDHYGLSPIEAAATAIDIHNTAAKWNKALLDNSARPSGALVYSGRDGRMSAEQFERLKGELESSYQGAKHAGRPLLLEGGLDWKALSLSPKDMDFIEAKHAAAREIALALGVPPMLLGIPGDNTYTDDPHDPGGPTNKGILLRELADWKGVTLDALNTEALKAELRAIPAETVRAIYFKRYWLPAGCDDLPEPLALMHFDAAVNQGVGTAARMLQQAVGAEADGEIGPLTRAAIAQSPTHKTLAAYADIRRRRYRALPQFWRFGRGWLNRIDTTLGRAQSLMGSPGEHIEDDQQGDLDMAKVTEKQAASKWWGSSVTIWGIIVTTLSTVVPALAPVIGVDIPGDLVRDAGGQLVTTVQAVGGLLGTLMTIFGRVRATHPLQRRELTVRL